MAGTRIPESSGGLPPQIGLHRPFAATVDAGLQSVLESALDKKRSWRALIEQNKMAVGLVDLSTPQAARFASVNGYTMMYAASLPKIAVLLAAYQNIQEGLLRDSPALHAWLVRMIRQSNNSAASYLIGVIGLQRIEDLLLRYQFYVPQYGGGIWLGAAYPPGALRNPDPIKGLCHAATAMQLCRFYYMLVNGGIISPKRSRQMLEILSKPALHDKFVSVLEPQVSPDRLFRKSGEWSVYFADSVLVWDHDCRKYILAALVDDKNGEQILRDLVPVVEKLLAPAQIQARARQKIASLQSSAAVKQTDTSTSSNFCSTILQGFQEFIKSLQPDPQDTGRQ